MFEAPVLQWSAERAECPNGLQCEDQPPRPFWGSRCVDASGHSPWPLVDAFLEVWSPPAMAGVIQDPEAPEYYPLAHPDRVMEAIEEVAALNPR